MARMYVITGGANSGKARWAITYFAHFDNVLYINSHADMEEDTRRRMDFSNNKHGVKWDVVRSDGAPADIIDSERRFFIFDGLPEYVLSFLDGVPDDGEIPFQRVEEITKQAMKGIQDMLDKIAEIDGNIIIITLETGFSVAPLSSAQKAFRDILGTVNQRVSNMADEVYLSISGIQMQIK